MGDRAVGSREERWLLCVAGLLSLSSLKCRCGAWSSGITKKRLDHPRLPVPIFLLLLLRVRVAYVYVCMCAHMLVSTHCVWVCVEGRGSSSDPISTSLGQGLLAGHYACRTINMGAKDLNSGLHTCETISFPIEPFPQLPWALNFESLKPYW